MVFFKQDDGSDEAMCVGYGGGIGVGSMPNWVYPSI